ncbi:uncharacterized protein [Temnothorax nylanderi]|uniref:uncharacterized protein n=1 Tax=Temnothorax nylanderi TaxID=102681 RepID=UPI003A8C2173
MENEKRPQQMLQLQQQKQQQQQKQKQQKQQKQQQQQQQPQQRSNRSSSNRKLISEDESVGDGRVPAVIISGQDLPALILEGKEGEGEGEEEEGVEKGEDSI